LAIIDSIGRALQTNAPIIGNAFAQALLQKLPNPIVVKQEEEDRRVIEDIRDLVQKIEEKILGGIDDQIELQKDVLNEVRHLLLVLVQVIPIQRVLQRRILKD
jgi:hypothetical protein